MVLNLVLAESAVERIPESLQKHPSVRRWAERRDKKASDMLLERSFHHAAMVREGILRGRRGRPDIAHLSILEALGTPLNREGSLRFFLHTWQDLVAEIPGTVRMPRSYERFRGLLEQLLAEGRIPTKGTPLITLRRMDLGQLTKEIGASKVIGLTRAGEKMTMEHLVRETLGETNLAVLVGGFAEGGFNLETEKLVNRLVSVDRETLDSQIVIGRFIYEYERALGLPERRL